MKYLVVLAFVLFWAGCGGSQPETDPAINIPVEEEAIGEVNVPDLNAPINLANENVCHVNMQTAATSIVMYQAQHGNIPATLAEAGAVSVCPEGGSYIYTVEGQSWKLECAATPSHGFIENGSSSW